MNAKPKPTVSVIIPTFNRAQFIERAIRSVLGQTFRDLELIIIDDGSTDGTAELIKQLIELHPRIRYIQLENNLGSQAARNAGIRVANGKYIGFLDSDDEWFPDKLEKQLDLFSQSDERYGVVYSGFRRVFSDGSLSTEYIPFHGSDIYNTGLIHGTFPHTCSLLIKKEVLLKAGCWNESFRARQEWDLCLRLAKIADFGLFPEVLMATHYHEYSQIHRNPYLSASGYEDFINTYRNEIIKVAGRKRLALYCTTTGQEWLRVPEYSKANLWFTKALRLNILCLEAWKGLIYVYLGAAKYNDIIHIRKIIAKHINQLIY